MVATHEKNVENEHVVKEPPPVPPKTPQTPTPLAAQSVSAAAPKVAFTMLASGNVLVRLWDTALGIEFQAVISAANWALLVAMSGAGSFMQFTVQSGGQLAPQPPA